MIVSIKQWQASAILYLKHTVKTITHLILLLVVLYSYIILFQVLKFVKPN